MLIDCDRCEMRNIACSDCVVNVLMGGGTEELDGDERQAIGVLAAAGMVPPLRLTVAGDPEEDLRQARSKKTAESWPRSLPGMRSAG